MQFRFASVLRKYEKAYIFVMPGLGEYDSDGVWESTSSPSRVSLRGHIQPVSVKLQQSEGGRYNEDDRTLYTLNKHNNGDLIEYQGKQYNIDAYEPREYSDINQYILKARVVHDPV